MSIIVARMYIKWQLPDITYQVEIYTASVQGLMAKGKV